MIDLRGRPHLRVAWTSWWHVGSLLMVYSGFRTDRGSATGAMAPKHNRHTPVRISSLMRNSSSIEFECLERKWPLMWP